MVAIIIGTILMVFNGFSYVTAQYSTHQAVSAIWFCCGIILLFIGIYYLSIHKEQEETQSLISQKAKWILDSIPPSNDNNTKQTTGTIPYKAKSTGSWTCKECGFINESQYRECHNCWRPR